LPTGDHPIANFEDQPHKAWKLKDSPDDNDIVSNVTDIIELRSCSNSGLIVSRPINAIICTYANAIFNDYNSCLRNLVALLLCVLGKTVATDPMTLPDPTST